MVYRLLTNHAQIQTLIFEMTSYFDYIIGFGKGLFFCAICLISIVNCESGFQPRNIQQCHVTITKQKQKQTGKNNPAILLLAVFLILRYINALKYH